MSHRPDRGRPIGTVTPEEPHPSALCCQCAIIEQLVADLIDGPLAHLPDVIWSHFAANAAWLTCAGIAHNLLRAAGTLISRRHGHARGATLRRHGRHPRG